MDTAPKIDPAPALRRSLTRWDGVALLVGITIGVGIYSTPQIIATYQDSYLSILGLWIGTGFFVMLGGLVYGELGARLPYTGGEYVYMHRVYGPFAGFVFGWAQLFIIRTSPAAGLSIVTANYIGHFVPLSGWTHTAVALTVICCIGVLNYIGVRQANWFQRITTVAKVFGLAALAVAGMILVQRHAFPLDMESPATVGQGPAGHLVAALMLVLFSYVGWDRVGYVAGEMKDPKRTIPFSMVVGISIVMAVYLAIVTMYHLALGLDGVRGSVVVAVDASSVFLGPWGASVVGLLVIVSALGSINGTYMASTRVYYAMARDGLFFKWLNHIHPRFRTPSRAVIVHGVWGAVILLVRGSFETIVAGMIFAILIFYVFTTVALFKLRRDEVGDPDGFRVPWYPVLPAIYLVGLVAMVVFRAVFDWQNSLMDLAFIATGLPAAWYLKRRGSWAVSLGS